MEFIARQEIVVVQARLMSIGERNEWIPDMFRRKCIGLDGWLTIVVEDRKFGFREEI